MATKPVLPKPAVNKIGKLIDEMFAKMRERFLGPWASGKTIVISTKAQNTIPGLYIASARAEGAPPDKEVVDHLVDNVNDFLDAYQAKAKVQVAHKVQSFLNDAKAQGIKTDFETVLGGQLAEVFANTKADVKRLIDTEATSARNLGTLEGITKVNASLDIDDPVVFFVVVRDQHLCSECKRLHLMDDETTPRLWKLSEVGHGYHKRGDENPKISGLHPNCRCTMATMMPGYGFDSSGMVDYIKEDHNEFKEQRKVSKVEYEPHDCDLHKNDTLGKMALADIRLGQKVEPPDKMFHKYDYSHVLSPEHQAAGYKMHVYVGEHPVHKDMKVVRASLSHPQAPQSSKMRHPGEVGQITGVVSNGKLEVGESHVLEPHRGGKGMPLYEALMAHAKNGLAAHTVGGGIHSTMAMKARMKVAQKHGMAYDPKPHFGPGKQFETAQEWENARTGEYDEKYSPTSHALKSEEEYGEDLIKSLPTSDFERMLGEMGWEKSRVSKEHYFDHPTVTQGAHALEGRTRQLVLGHNQQHHVDDYKIKGVLADAGLRWRADRKGLEPKPGHIYHKLYQASGHAPVLNPVNTWQTTEQHPGIKHVPLENLISTRDASADWTVPKHEADMKSGRPVPHITAVDAGDGKYMIEHGDDIHEAAKRQGKTHAPVLVSD